MQQRLRMQREEAASYENRLPQEWTYWFIHLNKVQAKIQKEETSEISRVFYFIFNNIV